jgi:hypothetical protein
MKKLLAVWMLCIAGSTVAQSVSGDVIGTVVQFQDQKPVQGAKAIIKDQDKVYLALSDIDGRFRIVNIPTGMYALSIVYKGDTVSGIKVDVPIEAFANAGTIELSGKVQTTKVIMTNNSREERARIQIGEVPMTTLTAKTIKYRPDKFSVTDIVANSSSDIKKDEDGNLMFRGARKGDMIYILDGIKSNEIFNVPSSAIGRMNIYTGGLPAKYGDTLGGAVILETKSYFDLYREWEMTQED